MLLSRRLDDREILLKRQNRVFFQSAGRATRRSASPPARFSGPGTTGFTCTIATAPCAWPWA
jgi:hypothetical protein